MLPGDLANQAAIFGRPKCRSLTVQATRGTAAVRHAGIGRQMNAHTQITGGQAGPVAAAGHEMPRLAAAHDRKKGRGQNENGGSSIAEWHGGAVLAGVLRDRY